MACDAAPAGPLVPLQLGEQFSQNIDRCGLFAREWRGRGAVTVLRHIPMCQLGIGVPTPKRGDREVVRARQTVVRGGRLSSGLVVHPRYPLGGSSVERRLVRIGTRRRVRGQVFQ